MSMLLLEPRDADLRCLWVFDLLCDVAILDLGADAAADDDPLPLFAAA